MRRSRSRGRASVSFACVTRTGCDRAMSSATRSTSRPSASTRPRMGRAIHRINPFSFADAVTGGLADPHNLHQYYKDANLVLALIGDDVKEETRTEIAVSGDERPPVLIARTLRGGDAIRLILLR